MAAAMLLPRPRRNLPWAPKVNDGEEPKGGTMRRVGSALPLEIRAWLVAASAVLFGSLATPPLIKHIGPWQFGSRRGFLSLRRFPLR